MLDAIMSWNTLWWILMIIYVPACIGLIGIVLLQQGKGTGFAGAFGAGAGGPGADTVFGPKGAQTMPVKLTYVGATIFMVVAIVMSLLSGHLNSGDAPELIENVTSVSATGEATTGGGSGLDTLGIGTGIVNSGAHSGAPAPVVTPVAVDAEPSDAAADEEGATAEDASAEEGQNPAN